MRFSRCLYNLLKDMRQAHIYNFSEIARKFRYDPHVAPKMTKVPWGGMVVPVGGTTASYASGPRFKPQHPLTFVADAIQSGNM